VPPGFGLRQSSGAFRFGLRLTKRQRAAAVQDATESADASSRFMVPQASCLGYCAKQVLRPAFGPLPFMAVVVLWTRRAGGRRSVMAWSSRPCGVALTRTSETPAPLDEDSHRFGKFAHFNPEGGTSCHAQFDRQFKSISRAVADSSACQFCLRVLESWRSVSAGAAAHVPRRSPVSPGT
jgi:hypothetical protein